jgi:hypothetical protein
MKNIFHKKHIFLNIFIEAKSFHNNEGNDRVIINTKAL